MMDEKKLETLRKNELDKAIKRKENHDRLQREKFFGNEEGKFPQIEKPITFEMALFRLKQKIEKMNKPLYSNYSIPNLNVVRIHNKQESMEHYLTKCISNKLFADHNEFSASEIFDSDQYLVNRDSYAEFQKEINKNILKNKMDKFNDVFIIDLNKVDGLKELVEYSKRVYAYLKTRFVLWILNQC